MSTTSVIHALIGGALIGLAASIAWLAQGRIAGVSGVVGRALVRDGGAGFRLPFLAGLIGVGVITALIAPSAIGAAVRGPGGLAIAGLLVGFGATISNGCTSGHGVCGLSRGSLRSLVAVIVFMMTGALTVALVGAHG